MNMERRRIQTEIREEDAQESADAFANGWVWRGTQLARSISGTNHTTNRIGFQALRDEHARWFSRGNFFFCATGNVPDVGKLMSRLGAIEPGSVATVVEDAPVPPDFFHRGAAIHAQDRGYTWLRFSFDADTARHSEMAYMNLEEYLLGDVGKLYLALSEDTGLVYDLSDDFERFANIGCMSFEFEVEPGRLYEAVDAVVGALEETKCATDAALEGAKAGGIRNDIIKRDYVCTFNNQWGYDNGMRHCGFETLDQRTAAYAGVRPEEIRRLAREVFTTANLTLCIRGNKRRIDTERIRGILGKLG